MPTVTVRKLDPRVIDALKQRGLANGRSMEAEVRAILTDIVDGEQGLGSRIRSRFIGLEWDGPVRQDDEARFVSFDE